MRQLVAPSSTVGYITPQPTYLTTSLPRGADACYALFCDVERIPEWLSVVRSAVVTRRDARDRARDVAFLARLEGASIGYTCQYRYDPRERFVAWSTHDGTAITVQGFAQFTELTPRACLMTYNLDLDLGKSGSLPAWSDPMFDGHAASATLHDFRDFVSRTL